MKIGISLPVRELRNDLGAIREFAIAAEELGLNHLRVPDQILRPGAGHLHEPMLLLAYVAAITHRIELVPSVIVAPSRQTVLLAKQAAELDHLCGGRLRLGVGVGGSRDEYRAMGQDFHTRGQRMEEQIELLNALWTLENVDFQGRWDNVVKAGLDPLPLQRPIPLWIGAASLPTPRIRDRIGRHAAGWFVLCTPEEFPSVHTDITAAASRHGRDPSSIGAEAGVAVVGPRRDEWQSRVSGWRDQGLTHVCLRTLGGELDPAGHVATMKQAVQAIPTL
ncbi:TIGR03619 family F420-dependent LLM class oxidoreductase [Myxococcota bacterium]|nr:TIGR03619 family F420-dependent LLM class oxidoreductase [Myxococcota bacterium]